MVTQYQQDATTLFQKNPNYYGTPPHIDGFGLQYFSNEDAEVTALRANEIDVIENVPADLGRDDQGAPASTLQRPEPHLPHVHHQLEPVQDDEPGAAEPAGSQAFEYAIDRQQIVQTAWLGYAHPGDDRAAGDRQLARLLDPAPAVRPREGQRDPRQLGYAKGSDDIRVANGHPMQYNVIFPGSERGAGDRAFQIIQSDFAQIGVKLVQQPTTGAYADMTAPDNKYENWDLAMWDWTPPIDPDFILSVMTCGSFGDWSDSGYCNKSYDALYAKQGRTVDPQPG